MMITIICITILYYLITGRDVKHLVEKVKNVNWKERSNKIFRFIKRYAMKVGRLTVKPLLMAYYVLTDAETSTTEKAMIYGCLLYVVLPVSLIPRSLFKILGVMDEAAAVLFVIKKINNKITPKITAKTEATLNSWFKEAETTGVPVDD